LTIRISKLPSKDGKLNLTLLILTLMFGITILVRLLYLDNVQFLEDEAAALILSYQNIHRGPVLVSLQSSTGLYNPSLFIYLLSPADKQEQLSSCLLQNSEINTKSLLKLKIISAVTFSGEYVNDLDRPYAM